MKSIYLFLFLFLTSVSTAHSQNSTEQEFASVLRLEHVCGDNLGLIEMQLHGWEAGYQYYWEHGPTDLLITDLEPGTYAFVVIDFYGCMKKYKIIVHEITDECSIVFKVKEISACERRITVFLETGGQLISDIGIEVVWSDGYVGLTRDVNLVNNSFSMGVIATVMNQDEICCTATDHIFLDAIPPQFCGEDDDDDEEERCKTPIIVNEFGGRKHGQKQFVELMVVGKCECEGKTDIRGFYFDDNNGFLLPSNEFVNEMNAINIGASSGFMTFSQSETWASVPNGSLIVIFEEGGNIPYELDPADSNNDQVYILRADNPDAFVGKGGAWNSLTQEFDYQGELTPSTWDLVKMESAADGMQVRSPEGEYYHGLSHGSTAFMSENEFPMWVGANTPEDCNCRLVEEDFFDKTHYNCKDSLNASGYLVNTSTPGLANSLKNKTFRDDLITCPPSSGLVVQDTPPTENKELTDANVSSASEKEEGVVVYPNPFQNQLNLSILATTSGNAQVEIYTISGKLYATHIVPIEEGISNDILPFTGAFPSGMLLMKFTLPSGKVIYQRVIQAH